MHLEPAVSAYRSVRRKAHGIGRGSRVRAIKLALAMYCITNGIRPLHARLAWWLAVHGTPKMPPPKEA